MSPPCPDLSWSRSRLVREMTGWETSKNTAGMDMDRSERHPVGQSHRAQTHAGVLRLVYWRRTRNLAFRHRLSLCRCWFFSTRSSKAAKNGYTSLIIGACAYLLIWGLFEYMLETRWPPGLSAIDRLVKRSIRSTATLVQSPTFLPRDAGRTQEGLERFERIDRSGIFLLLFSFACICFRTAAVRPGSLFSR